MITGLFISGEDEIVDVPKVGFYYEDVTGSETVIYKCIEIDNSYTSPYIMEDITDGSTHPFEKWGWKKVEKPSNVGR